MRIDCQTRSSLAGPALRVGDRHGKRFRSRSCSGDTVAVNEKMLSPRRGVAVRAVIKKGLGSAAADRCQISGNRYVPCWSDLFRASPSTVRSVAAPGLTASGFAAPVARRIGASAAARILRRRAVARNRRAGRKIGADSDPSQCSRHRL